MRPNSFIFIADLKTGDGDRGSSEHPEPPSVYATVQVCMVNVNVTGKGLMGNAFPHVLPHFRPILMSPCKSGHHLKTTCSVYEAVLYVQCQSHRPVLRKKVSGENFHIIRPIITPLNTNIPYKLEFRELGVSPGKTLLKKGHNSVKNIQNDDLQFQSWPVFNNVVPFCRLYYLDSMTYLYEPVHEIFNNVVCATSKGSDQPAQTRSLIRAFANRLSILL